MNDDELISQLRAAIREKARMSPGDYFADAVRRGVIDEQGRVLLRIPQPPRTPRQSKKASPGA